MYKIISHISRMPPCNIMYIPKSHPIRYAKEERGKNSKKAAVANPFNKKNIN